MHPAPIRVLACSPRARGNSDFMVHNFVQGVRSSGGHAEVSYLRDYNILPCTVCLSCMENSDSRCILTPRDDADLLFQQLLEAPLVFIASPIFFYHLPAQLKALIDRSQSYWAKREKARKAGTWTAAAAHTRPALAGLVAARTRGDKLFEGSLLTLQYFFDLLGLRLTESCQMMGYDNRDDLAADGVACMRLYELGAKAQAMVVENAGRQES